MPEPIGEAFIEIRPLFTAFREQVRAGVAQATAGVQQQVAQATAVRPSGVILPPGIRSVAAETEKASSSMTKFGDTTTATEAKVAKLQTTQVAAAGATGRFSREVQNAERDTNRFARGTIAATAASSGLFRAVSFASGAFLLGAIAGGAIASAVQKFRDEAILAAQTEAILKATGNAAHVTAGQVDELAKSQARLTGISQDVIHQGENVLLTFKGITNQVGAGNDVFTRAAKDLLDISSVMHTNVSSSAIQLGKALQDPEKGVTALRRSGITLTESQRALIKELVSTGRTLTAQKVVLKAIEDQVGGTAVAVGQTLPGKLNILKERARSSLGEYVKRITESQRATQLFDETVAGAGNVLSTVKSLVATLGPPLLAVAEAIGKTVQALGGAEAVLAFVVAFKGVKLAVSLATAAQALYTRSVLVGTGAITAQEAALLSSAGAFRSQSVAALAGSTVTGVAGAEGRAVAIGAVGAEAGAAAAGVGGLRVALGALGGPIGIAAIGAGALALAFLKLRNNSPSGTIQETKHALDGLNASLRELAKIGSARAGALENVTIASAGVTSARAGVNAAELALANTRAQPGSLEQVFLTDQLAEAERRLTAAERGLGAARQAVNAQTDARRNAERTVAQAAAETTRRLQAEVKGLRDLAIANNSALAELRREAAAPGATSGASASRIAQEQAKAAAQGIQNVLGALSKLETSGDRATAAIGKTLRVLVQTLNAIPTQKQINIVITAVAKGQNSKQILARLGILDPTQGGTSAEQNRLDVTQPLSATIAQEIRGARALLDADQKTLATAQKTLTTKRQALQVAQDAVHAAQEQLTQAKQAEADARQALTDARQAARDAQQNLADTVKAARLQINQAVTDAKSNLDSLGQAIASALSQAGVAVSGAGGALGKQFRALRAQIIAGQGGPETQQAAQQVAARLQAQSGGAATDFQKRLADLTDSLDRGKISLPQFNKQLNAILKGIDFSDLRKRLGTAFVNTLLDEIKALRQQAALILGGPQRPGGGNPPAIVRPLQAVADAGRQIVLAQRGIAQANRGVTTAERQLRDSQRGVLDAERRLREVQSKETKANTAAIQANTKASNALAKVNRDIVKLNDPPGKKPKVKPIGAAAQAAGAVIRGGGNSP